MATNSERFWRQVDRRGDDECWPWTGGLKSGGYGAFHIGGRQIGAHRYAAGCRIGDGVVVMHTCDNPPCCNPAHLRKGTIADNNADRSRKGRNADIRGERNVNAKLRAADVHLIRQLATKRGMQTSLAKRYGMSEAQISRIVNGTRWASA